MSKMSKMIVLTPDQFAKLLKGSEKINESQQKVESDLSSYVRSLGKGAPKPEQFDRFQNLFNRFLSDQRRAREPVRIPIHDENDLYDEEEEGLGGLSFRRADEADASVLNRASHSRLSSAPSFRTFKLGKRKRASTASTPKTKPKKRKSSEITPNKDLADVPRKLRWRLAKVN